MKVNLKTASKFIEPNLLRRRLLIEEISVCRTPVIGTILYDDSAEFRKIRDFRKQVIKFKPIYAHYIDSPLLTNEFIIHDDDNLFVDTSIVSAAAEGREVESVAEKFFQEIDVVDRAVSDEFADETALVIHNEGGGTWGHFIIQNFPKVLLYLRDHPGGKIVVPRAHRELDSNYGRLFEMHGIPQSCLLPVDRDKTYRFRELVIMDFLYDFPSAAIHPVALDLLERSLVALDPMVSSKSRDRQAVFIERSANPGNRAITNTADLRPILAAYNVISVRLGMEHVRDQAKTWMNSRLIVSTLGSDLANIIYSKPGTRILALSPDWFGDNFFYNLAVAKGVQWNELRCGHIAEKAEFMHSSSFFVDREILDTMLKGLTRVDCL